MALDLSKSPFCKKLLYKKVLAGVVAFIIVVGFTVTALRDDPNELKKEAGLFSSKGGGSGLFRRAPRPLREAGKVGAVLIYFPPWFVPSDANRAYLAQARRQLPADSVIVEFRNRLWVADEASAAATFALLRDLSCGFVCVDEPAGLTSTVAR